MKNLTGIVGIFLLIFLIHSCEKDDKNTIKDVDGNVYTSVTIGTQEWMVENLKTTKYNDGTAIPNITDNEAQGSSTTGAYCWYDNDITNKTPYGALYNFYAVVTGKLCPTGWHVPSEVEWTTLTTYLGGDSVAGGKLKETGTTHWLTPITGATNETGFTALPGGRRNDDGSFDFIGGYGYWWSSTEYFTNYAYIRGLLSDASYVPTFGDFNKYHGLSVRCLRDN